MQRKFLLEKPKLLDRNEIFKIKFNPELSEKCWKGFSAINKSGYLYWDKIKYKSPEGVAPEIFWSFIKDIRRNMNYESVILNEEGFSFTWRNLASDQLLHELDLHMGGDLAIDLQEVTDLNKQHYISRGIMEEAIASSQLEGASTTRVQAKQFLREGRKPSNYSEHMILNNFNTMKMIENEYKNSELDLSLLHELHARITQNTISVDRQGVFRTDADNVRVVGNNGEWIYFIPPKIEFVKKEMERLFEFANDRMKTGFIHPIIKAIMLHFWVGYLHPYIDGNGRLARNLFYWYLLKKGYWAFAYLPISTMIKKSAQEYKMAYIYSEQDDDDLNYFLDYNMRKIELAKNEFEKYMATQIQKNRRIKNDIRDKYKLNHRQMSFLKYYYDHPQTRTNPTLYAKTNNVSKLTGIKDLKDLLNKGFVTATRVGKNVFYYRTEKINELFE
jgi:Fic family protein